MGDGCQVKVDAKIFHAITIKEQMITWNGNGKLKEYEMLLLVVVRAWELSWASYLIHFSFKFVCGFHLPLVFSSLSHALIQMDNKGQKKG